MYDKNQIFCCIDYETYSEANLKDVGAYEYSMHPSTEIICAAWRIGTREQLRTAKTCSWVPSEYKNIGTIDILLEQMLRHNVMLVAHNAFFEQCISLNCLPKYTRFGVATSPKRWICTASQAAALALPRNLEGAAQVLRLPVQKDMEGRRLILKWCKPKRPSKKDPSTRHSDPAELQRIVEYCKRDVAAEVELFLATPPLHPTEREVWILDQKINLRGFEVDRPLVNTVLDMIETETDFINQQTAELTNGALRSARQRDAVLSFLQDEGVFLPDLQKKTVDDAVKNGLVTGKAKELLEYRQAISMSSTAKYPVFEECSRTDGRLRDMLLYHAASTGRWGGVRVQPQNFPRGTIKDPIKACEILALGDLELVRMIYGEPMQAFSSCLRGMIVAPPGKVLDVADYAAIEARVLFWVAKHEEGLKAFREGRDLYKEMAQRIYNVNHVENVTKDQRWLGKTAILGCGYGMGVDRFEETCLNLGQEIGPDLSAAAVYAYRDAHSPVVKLWKNYELAAMAAIENPGKKYTLNYVSWWVRGGFLWCELPSGRRLAYHQPSVRMVVNKYKQRVKAIYHYGIDSYTKQWCEQKTWGGTLVENVVQAIARDLMAAAMLRIEAAGPWEIVLSVHDELLAERDIFGGGSNQEFCRLMAELPPWATGCPVQVEGWEGPRYKK